MKISVFGLGYVGVVCAACLADDGHTVIGVEPNQVKVDLVNAGRSPVVEEGLGDLVSAAVTRGCLRATTDCGEAVTHTDLALLCVGTPSRTNGSLDVSYLGRVSEQIGAALKQRDGFFVVAVRSTVLPGTASKVVIRALERTSGRRLGQDFGVCVYPEFMREGSAISDFYHPPKIVIGASDERSRQRLTEIVSATEAPMFQTNIELAEVTKYVDNAWHAIKVAFANEMGVIAKTHGLDGRQVMEVFCADQKLNLSSSYLRPGFAFGGSCLPKDVRALNYESRSLDLDLPLLNAVLPSNRAHLDRAFQAIARRGHCRVGVLGLSFKAGTDDLRESPMVDVVERLIGKGFDIMIYDGKVNVARLIGSNREYILSQVPHIAQLMVSSKEEVLDHAETVVIGNGDDEFKGVLDELREGQYAVDLVGVSDSRTAGERVVGIAW
jgi:GDP-mannose 6-dehydrogenase